MGRSRLMVMFVVLCAFAAMCDDTFDKLFSAGKYKEAIEYADQKILPASRDAAMWVKIAEANEKAGLIEKALASYMVSWRMNPNDYASLLGAARIYNKLEQFDNAESMARKALDQQFTADASWEYARACIALKRPADAKKALEKVMETDPGNAVANRELGIIYYNDKEYKKAVPLLKKSYETKADPDVAYQIGKSYLEGGGKIDAAIDYLKKAVEANSKNYDAGLDLARAYVAANNYNGAAEQYSLIAGKANLAAVDYFNQAEALEKTGKKKEAINAYRAAISKYGTSTSKDVITARYKVGSDDLNNKRFTEALTQLQPIEKSDPKAIVVKDIYFLLAEAYLGANNIPAAIASLEKAIGLDKSNVEAYARLADLYTQSKMLDKAKVTYEKMMSLSPNDPKVYLVLGGYNLKARKYSEALDLFVKSNSLGKSAAALEGIALAAAALNQWDKARDAAESAVEMDGSLTESRIVLADALMRVKNYKDAKTHLEVLMGKEPSNSKYLESLAECYDKTNDDENLARIDKKLIDADKKNTTSRMRYMRYSLKKGDKETAYGLLKELAVLKPSDPAVFKNLYELALEKSDKANGIAYLRKYVGLNGNDAEAQKILGDLLYEVKDYDGALAAYRQALQIDPGIKGFYKRYADIVIAKGQQDEVIKALSGVIKTGEADLSTYTTLGMIYLKKKMYSNAKEMYQKALMMDPANVDALGALGECQTYLGDISGAVITYEQAVMMNPNAVEEYKALGDLYMKQKKDDQGMKAYSKYLEKVPNDQEVSKKAGEYYYNTKDYKNAAKYLAAYTGKDAMTYSNLEMLCISYYQSENFAKVIEYADLIIARNPKLALPARQNILKMKAEALEKTNQGDKALLVYDDYSKIPGVRDSDMDYKRAFLREKGNPALAKQIYNENIQKYPTDSRNYMQLGLLYSQDKVNLAKAAPLLEKAAANAGKDQTLWLKIAQIYGKIGKEDKELAAYRKYIDSDPQNLDANIRIGTILMSKDKVTEGMVYLETANTFSPNNIDIIIPLSTGYLKTNRTKDAIDLLKKAKTLKPDDVELRRNLYKAYTALGDKKSAMNEIKELLDKKQDNSLLFLFAEMSMEEGNVKEAEEAIETITATDPENIEALMLLAKIQRSKKKLEEAIETYKEITYINASYAPALYERAETYMEQSKPQWAERFYDRALRADTTYGLAELGMAKVAKLRKDKDAYTAHLRKAKELDPSNPAIKEECSKAGI